MAESFIKLQEETVIDLRPYHECAICETVENPKAIIVTKEFWICDDCVRKLRKIMEWYGDEVENDKCSSSPI